MRPWPNSRRVVSACSLSALAPGRGTKEQGGWGACAGGPRWAHLRLRPPCISFCQVTGALRRKGRLRPTGPTSPGYQAQLYRILQSGFCSLRVREFSNSIQLFCGVGHVRLWHVRCPVGVSVSHQSVCETPVEFVKTIIFSLAPQSPLPAHYL